MNELENYLKNLEKDTVLSTYKASGPGGQHRNKTESAVRLLHQPTGLIVTASESRSQHKNRKMAWLRLRASLQSKFARRKPRKPTNIPGRVKEARLRIKKKRSLLKNTRKKPDPTNKDQAFCIL
ncbi:MAG: peptide chain release factor-like protein [Calditrichaeota bacterium]|nr:MAG: peptide chain release factor-like protein [Calditrichota bacterium]